MKNLQVKACKHPFSKLLYVKKLTLRVLLWSYGFSRKEGTAFYNHLLFLRSAYFDFVNVVWFQCLYMLVKSCLLLVYAKVFSSCIFIIKNCLHLKTNFKLCPINYKPKHVKSMHFTVSLKVESRGGRDWIFSFGHKSGT